MGADCQIHIASCDFTWHEDDDYLFFIKVCSFESVEEFEKEGRSK